MIRVCFQSVDEHCTSLLGNSYHSVRMTAYQKYGWLETAVCYIAINLIDLIQFNIHWQKLINSKWSRLIVQNIIRTVILLINDI